MDGDWKNESGNRELQLKFAELTLVVQEITRIMGRSEIFVAGEFSSIDHLLRAVWQAVSEIKNSIGINEALNDLPARMLERGLSSVTAEELADRVPKSVIDAARLISRQRMVERGEADPLPPPFNVVRMEPIDLPKPRPENSSPSLTIDERGIKLGGRLGWKKFRKVLPQIILAVGAIGLAIKHLVAMWPK